MPAPEGAGKGGRGGGGYARRRLRLCTAPTITSNPPPLPRSIVFVIKDGDQWTGNGGGDFRVPLRAPSATDLAARAAECEAGGGGSLFQRFAMANGMMDEFEAAGEPKFGEGREEAENRGGAAPHTHHARPPSHPPPPPCTLARPGPAGMGALLAWLRLSAARQLPWYSDSGYQSKDAAHNQKTLAQRAAAAAARAPDPLSRSLARAALACLPRGGGDGDAIRMGILNVMREHGIKEGHRPGLEEPFLEQWHQKLHTATTPEDVTICEARAGGVVEGWEGSAGVRGMLRPPAHPLADLHAPLHPTFLRPTSPS